MRSTSEGPFETFTAGKKIDVNTGGQFSSLCAEITGTITAGNLTLKGCLQDGATPRQLYTENVETGYSLGDGKITAAGLYRVAPAAIIHVYLIASDDFAQDPNDPVSAYITYSESLPPISIVGSV